MTIHIIEDDKLLREYSSKFLKKNYLEVFTYDSAEDFLEKSIIEDNDCIVIDINLAKKSGFEVLEELNLEDKNIKVIMISASKDIEDIEKAFSLGAYDYLKKPFELKELLFRIKSLYKQDEFLYKLNDHYYWQSSEQILYDTSYQNIELTKSEKILLSLLLSNKRSVVSMDMIQEYFEIKLEKIKKSTIRNILTSIKKKISQIDIINIYGEGYKINLKKENSSFKLQDLQEISDRLNEKESLDEILQLFCNIMYELFKSDRSFVMYVDQSLEKIIVPNETSSIEYPGAAKLNIQIPINKLQKEVYKKVINLSDPLILNYDILKGLLELPDAHIWEKMELPKSAVLFHFNINGTVWMSGLHQCSYERVWADEEVIFLKHCIMVLEKKMNTLSK